MGEHRTRRGHRTTCLGLRGRHFQAGPQAFPVRGCARIGQELDRLAVTHESSQPRQDCAVSDRASAESPRHTDRRGPGGSSEGRWSRESRAAEVRKIAAEQRTRRGRGQVGGEMVRAPALNSGAGSVLDAQEGAVALRRSKIDRRKAPIERIVIRRGCLLQPITQRCGGAV